MGRIEDKLAEYIAILASSEERTRHANERPMYTRHLAMAAVMFSDFHNTGSLAKLREHVQTERRSYGWSHLTGPEGAEAEKAFDQFARLVECATPST